MRCIIYRGNHQDHAPPSGFIAAWIKQADVQSGIAIYIWRSLQRQHPFWWDVGRVWRVKHMRFKSDNLESKALEGLADLAWLDLSYDVSKLIQSSILYQIQNRGHREHGSIQYIYNVNIKWRQARRVLATKSCTTVILKNNIDASQSIALRVSSERQVGKITCNSCAWNYSWLHFKHYRRMRGDKKCNILVDFISRIAIFPCPPGECRPCSIVRQASFVPNYIRSIIRGRFVDKQLHVVKGSCCHTDHADCISRSIGRERGPVD